MDRIWAVIVTYNGMAWIERCFGSLSQCGVTHTVVVDNSSTDETVEWIKTHRPDVVLRRLDKNVGFGSANNIGIQLALDAGAEWLLLVNQDIVFLPDTVRHLLAAASQASRFGVIGALQLTYDGSAIDHTCRYHLLPTRFYDDLVLGTPTVESAYEAPFVPAACVLIPRAALQEVGGFDPLFFLYGEDEDLCERMKHADWKIGIVPGAVVLHWHGFTNRTKTFRSAVNMAYSRALLGLKWSGRSLPVSLLELGLRSAIPRRSWRDWCAAIFAFGRCLSRIRSIGQSRSRVPHAFSMSRNVHDAAEPT